MSVAGAINPSSNIIIYYYTSLLLGSNVDWVEIVCKVWILSIAIQDTTRQRVTQHYALLTKEVYLITITAVRPKRVDAITITTRDYRTTSTPLNELTTTTTYLNDISLTVTLTEINEQERIWHQRFTCNRVKCTEHLHVIEQCTAFNRQLDTVSHLIRCKLTAKSQLLTRASDELRIDECEACSFLTKYTVKFSCRLYLV